MIQRCADSDSDNRRNYYVVATNDAAAWVDVVSDGTQTTSCSASHCNCCMMWCMMIGRCVVAAAAATSIQQTTSRWWWSGCCMHPSETGCRRCLCDLMYCRCSMKGWEEGITIWQRVEQGQRMAWTWSWCRCCHPCCCWDNRWKWWPGMLG